LCDADDPVLVRIAGRLERKQANDLGRLWREVVLRRDPPVKGPLFGSCGKDDS
jgi:hypothetical protein